MVVFAIETGGTDVGENVVFTLCLVKTAAAPVVADDTGFNKDEVVSIGENDVTVTLAAVVKDCSMLIFVPSEAPVKFTGGVNEGTSRGDVESCGTYAVGFSAIDSNELDVNVPSGFTCASSVGSVLVAISDNSIILVLTGTSVVLCKSGAPVKTEVAIALLSVSVLAVTACVAVAVSGSVALSTLVELLLISCILVDVSKLTVDGNKGEMSTEADKLTLDFVVPVVAVVLFPDVIFVDCEEIVGNKVTAGSVLLDVIAKISSFSVAAVSCNFVASVVSPSFASGTGNEVSSSLITAKLSLAVKCGTAGV